MGSVRQEIIAKVWGGTDPFAEKSAFRGRVDFQGWASDNPMLFRGIEEVRPTCVVEIGVWKGGSTMTMAGEMRRLGIDGAVISIDTWLGAADHWYQPVWFKDLRIEAGYPTLFRTFAANVIEKGLEDMIVPLPLDSLNAAVVLKHHALIPDLVHVDGGHDYNSVMADLKTWWPMIRPGGGLIGDDYHPVADVWVEVRHAFQDFFQTKDIDNIGGKCLVRKPDA